MDRPRIDGNTEANDRDAEPTALPHDAEVARHRQLGARADCRAVDVGNDGEWRMSNRGQHRIKIVMEGGGVHAAGEVCSSALGYLRPGPPSPVNLDGGSGVIQSICTFAGDRGQGLGRACFALVLDWFRDETPVRSLELFATEEGMPMYQRAGFEVTDWPAMRMSLDR